MHITLPYCKINYDKSPKIKTIPHQLTNRCKKHPKWISRHPNKRKKNKTKQQRTKHFCQLIGLNAQYGNRMGNQLKLLTHNIYLASGHYSFLRLLHVCGIARALFCTHKTHSHNIDIFALIQWKIEIDYQNNRMKLFKQTSKLVLFQYFIAFFAYSFHCSICISFSFSLFLDVSMFVYLCRAILKFFIVLID